MIIKVIDFGLSIHFQNETDMLSTPVGSMHYIAPEVLECEYNYKCDIWSCGVIAHILLCGFAPFEGATDMETRDLIMMGNISFQDPQWDHVSQQAKDFVTYLMTFEYQQRPTAEQCLQHPWIQQAHKVQSEQFKLGGKRMEQVIKCLEYCRVFEAASKLKQATCAFMASQLVLSSTSSTSTSSPTSTGEDTKEENGNADHSPPENSTMMIIGEIFRAMDLDSDGRLSPKEFLSGFKDLLGADSITAEEVHDIFTRMDLSATGYIDYSEFVIASTGLHDLDQKDTLLQEAFQRLLDHDGSGFISKEKLRSEMVPFYGEDVEDEVIDKIIKQADLDQDGQISWEDFKAMMTKKAEFVPAEKPRIATKKASEQPGILQKDPGLSPWKLRAANTTAAAAAAAVKVDTHNTDPSPPPAPKENSNETPPLVRKSRGSTGPKARLISAIFEKNLEKNREMGFKTFQYWHQQQPSKSLAHLQPPQLLQKSSGPLTATKCRLPRTCRVNFEDLTKKANARIEFDPNAVKLERQKEIEQMKAATPGRARERRASLANMFTQKTEEQKKRRESRMQEIEHVNRNNLSARGRRELVEGAFKDSKKAEEQIKERRSLEVKRIRNSLVGDGGAKNRGMKLSELFQNPEKPTSAKQPDSVNTDEVKRLKELHERQLKGHDNHGDADDKTPFFRKLSEKQRQEQLAKFMEKQDAPAKAMTQNQLDCKHSHCKHSHLKKSPSGIALQDLVDREERLEQMQPHSYPPQNAAVIEPIRRQDSFNKKQEEGERGMRLEELEGAIDELSDTQEISDPNMDVSMSLQQALGDPDAFPTHTNTRLHTAEAVGSDRGTRLQQLQRGRMHSSMGHLAEEKKERLRELHPKDPDKGVSAVTAAYKKFNSSESAFGRKRVARLGELQGKSPLEILEENIKDSSSSEKGESEEQRNAKSPLGILEDKLKASKESKSSAKSPIEIMEENLKASKEFDKSEDENAKAHQVRSMSMNPNFFRKINITADKRERRHSLASGDASKQKPTPENPSEVDLTNHFASQSSLGLEEVTKAEEPQSTVATPASHAQSNGSLGYEEAVPSSAKKGGSNSSLGYEPMNPHNKDSMVGLSFSANDMNASAQYDDSKSSLDGDRSNPDLKNASCPSIGNRERTRSATDTIEVRAHVEKPSPRRFSLGQRTPKNVPRFNPNASTSSFGSLKKRSLKGSKRAKAVKFEKYETIPPPREAAKKEEKTAKDIVQKAKEEEEEDKRISHIKLIEKKPIIPADAYQSPLEPDKKDEKKSSSRASISKDASNETDYKPKAAQVDRADNVPAKSDDGSPTSSSSKKKRSSSSKKMDSSSHRRSSRRTRDSMDGSRKEQDNGGHGTADFDWKKAVPEPTPIPEDVQEFLVDLESDAHRHRHDHKDKDKKSTSSTKDDESSRKKKSKKMDSSDRRNSRRMRDSSSSNSINSTSSRPRTSVSVGTADFDWSSKTALKETLEESPKAVESVPEPPIKESAGLFDWTKRLPRTSSTGSNNKEKKKIKADNKQ